MFSASAKTGRLARAAGPRWRFAFVFALACGAAPVFGASTMPAFPGAQGWAAHTPGGRGGAILRVTTLAAAGPGSLAAAIATPGPRIVVFEVGGVIDLGRTRLVIDQPFLTVAAHTAPSPGITLIRGGIQVTTHDVVLRHLRVRTGSAGVGRMAGWDIDSLSTQSGARDVIVDHCSFTWGTDENLSASGRRFEGDGPDAWRRSVSHRITFSHNIIAEGLRNSTHSKGEHSKGTLLHDNVNDVLLVGNLYAHNHERNPLLKGGARALMVNNLIYDPGPRAVHYNLIAEEWIEYATYERGRAILLGNVLRAGPSTPPDLALLMLGGSGDLEYFARDNVAVDRLGKPLPLTGRYTTSRARMIELDSAPALPHGVRVLHAADVQDAVVLEAGATPWDRDAVDRRIVANVIEGRGAIIDSEQEVGGYPAYAPTQRAFDPAAWNLDTMEPLTPPPRSEPPR